jgi:hypothetical protein
MRARAHTPQRGDPDLSPPVPSPSSRERLRAAIGPLVLVAAAGGLIALFFLGLYWVKRYNMPIGWDTPRYLDQTNLVAAHGLSGVPRELPPPIKTLPSRGAFPVTVLTLASLFGLSTFKLAATVPVAAVMAMALAAGALVTWTFRRGAWTLAAASLIIGTSAVAIRLTAPETYTDNLIAAAILVAALVPLLSTATGGGGFVAAILLLGIGAVAHGPSFAIVALALCATAAVVAPASWRAWRRRDADLLATPTARLAGAVAGGGVVALVAFFGILRAPPDTPKVSRGELIKKLREDVPLYRSWLTAPLAALGAFALWRGDRAGRTAKSPGGSAAEATIRDAPEADAIRDAPEAGAIRTTDGQPSRCGWAAQPARLLLVVLLSWTAVTLAGVALYLSGRNAPAHRLLSFLIPLPVLMAIAVLWIGRQVSARARRTAGAAVVAAAIVALGVVGYHDLYSTLAGPSRGVEWLDQGKVQDAATAAAYLDAARVPANAPVVFVVDDPGPNPLSFVPEMAYMLRAVLPADRVPHAYIYVGNPDRYLGGRPTYRDHPRTYNANVDRFWPTVRRLLPRHPVALVLSSYNPMYRAEAARHPDLIVAPNVLALAGPKPATPVAAPPIPTGPRGAAQGVLVGVATLVAVTLIGWGWSFALLPRTGRPFEIFALAPALGLAALLAAGIVADAVGVRMVGLSGAMIPILAAAAGVVAAILRRRGDGVLAGRRASP